MTILLAFLFMLLVVGAMSIGVMFGRQPIKGSCGGLAQLGLGSCEICGGDPARCEAESGSVEGNSRSVEGNSRSVEGNSRSVEVNDLGYDASTTQRRRD
jgi:hypothetical protein